MDAQKIKDELTEILLLQAKRISRQSEGITDISGLSDAALALCHLEKAIYEVIYCQRNGR